MMETKIFLIIVGFIFITFAASQDLLGVKDLVFIILSQNNRHHLKLAETVKNNLYRQAKEIDQGPAIIYLTHTDFPHVGDWTILPIIPKLYDLHKNNCSWLIFLEDRTEIHLKNLLNTLNQYDSNQSLWLGHALHDNEATIIHHFAFYNNPEQFKYPNLASGIAISSTLLQSLNNRLVQQHYVESLSDFGIDSSHELALFIWNNGNGEHLQHESRFCIEKQLECATFPNDFQQCDELVKIDSIYFAVKTCKKYHKERLPIVKRTWAKYTTRIRYFSDIEDDSIPTISLGIPNTEQGHCSKTMAILKFISMELRNLPEIHWIILADDDTILGISKIRQLLTCYNPNESIILGERYGYNVYNTRGYNYITGGGGIVFSRQLIKQLVRPGICECPSMNTPDDMYLGLCIASLGINVTHSPLFHQARPVDYSPQRLNTDNAVSFHKYWMMDPIQVYNKWFADDDLILSKFNDEL